LEPLLPSAPAKPKGGRPRVPDRAALNGILFVLKSGIPWEMLARELGCGSGVTCWRPLRDWQAARVWDWLHRVLLHRVLLDRLGEADRIDWSRALSPSPSSPLSTWFWTPSPSVSPLSSLSQASAVPPRSVSTVSSLSER
jgi:transposase